MTVRKLSYQHETLKVGRSDKYIQYTHAVRQPRFLDNKVLTSSLYPLQFHSVPNGQHNRAPHTQNAFALSFTTQGFLFFCFFGAPQWNLKSTMDWPQPVRLSCTISSIFWQKLTFGGWMMRVMTVFVSQHGETLPSSVWMWKKPSLKLCTVKVTPIQGTVRRALIIFWLYEISSGTEINCRQGLNLRMNPCNCYCFIESLWLTVLSKAT